MNRRAIFLDRDGVINSYVYNAEFGTVDSPSTPEEFELNPGVPEAIAAFRDMGFLVVVVSNQPGIAKGRFSSVLLDETTSKMLAQCGGGIDAVYYCRHHPQAIVQELRIDCDCRKPKPGLLLQAAAEMHMDLPSSYIIGDSFSDIVAGDRAGVRTMLVNPRKCYICEMAEKQGVIPDFMISRLADAVEIVKCNLP